MKAPLSGHPDGGAFHMWQPYALTGRAPTLARGPYTDGPGAPPAALAAGGLPYKQPPAAPTQGPARLLAAALPAAQPSPSQPCRPANPCPHAYPHALLVGCLPVAAGASPRTVTSKPVR